MSTKKAYPASKTAPAKKPVAKKDPVKKESPKKAEEKEMSWVKTQDVEPLISVPVSYLVDALNESKGEAEKKVILTESQSLLEKWSIQNNRLRSSLERYQESITKFQETVLNEIDKLV